MMREHSCSFQRRSNYWCCHSLSIAQAETWLKTKRCSLFSHFAPEVGKCFTTHGGRIFPSFGLASSILLVSIDDNTSVEDTMETLRNPAYAGIKIGRASCRERV